MRSPGTLLNLTVNGKEHCLSVRSNETLANVLRDRLNLTGTKIGCDMGTCGCCTVIVDGEARLGCLTLALECEGARVTTVEGLNCGAEMHPLQRSFAECGGSQCGFCTPGFIMSSKALLDKNPDPSLGEIKKAVSGNLCRCTGYLKIYEAILKAAGDLRPAPKKKETQPA